MAVKYLSVCVGTWHIVDSNNLQWYSKKEKKKKMNRFFLYAESDYYRASIEDRTLHIYLKTAL